MDVDGGITIKKDRERFIRFAEQECKGSSPLYERLSIQIAEDKELLHLSSFTQKGQPVPNLLFGAVHYLLLLGDSHPLRNYYPSLIKHPEKLEDVFLPFKDFCIRNKQSIKEILQTKLVQTNEVRRCAYLYPVFCYIYEKTKRPLALIEIGTSAGLQLFWDHYCYSYGDRTMYGNLESTVHITSECRRGNPPYRLDVPPVTSRTGVDLHINDLHDKENYLWLQALIWPEHHQRRELLKQATNYVKENSPTLMNGDGIALLPGLVSDILDDSVVCIFHTHVANQIPLTKKQALLQIIDDIGSKRDVFHLYNNMFDAELHLDFFLNGKRSGQLIGKTEGHGKWFEWKIEND